MTDQDDIHSCTAAIPCITVSAGISASIPEIEGFSAYRFDKGLRDPLCRKR